MKITQEFHQATRANRRRRKWQKLVRFLAMTVVFCTTYALILPAITMEAETICGKAAHTHTDDCYELVIPECTIPESENHVHDENTCYTLVTNQICQLEENEDHAHDPACYQVELKLQCQIPEYQGHSHAQDSMEPVKVSVCQIEEHIHGDTCFPEGAKPTDPDIEEPTPGEPLETDPDTTEMTDPAEPGATETPEATVPATETTEPDPTLGTAPKETDTSTQTPSEPTTDSTDGETQLPTQDATLAPTDNTTAPTGESTDPTTEEPTEEPTVTLVQTDVTEDGAKIQVRLPEDTQVPADAALTVTDLGSIALFAGRDAQLEEIRQILPEAESIVSLLDISFYNEAGDYIPVSDTAAVTIRYEGDVFGNQDVRVIHYTDDAVVIEDVTLSRSVNTDENGNETVSTLLSFETDGFSVFAVIKLFTVTDRITLGDPAELAGNSYYVVSNNQNYYMLDSIADSNAGLAKGSYTGVDSLNGVVSWTFEQVTDNTFYIYSSNGNYLVMADSSGETANVSVTTEKNNATIFTVRIINAQAEIGYDGPNGIAHYLNVYQGDKDFRGWKDDGIQDSGSKVYLHLAAGQETTYPTKIDLDGKSYALVRATSDTAGKAITATQTTVNGVSGLAGADVTITTTDGTRYVIADIPAWTFHAVADNPGFYTISTRVGLETKYLHLYETTQGNGGSIILGSQENATPIQVLTDGSGNVFLTMVDGENTRYINFDQTAGSSFWVYKQQPGNASSTITLCLLQASQTQDQYTVHYDMNLPADTTTLMGAKPTVNNEEDYSVLVESGGSHTLLDPYPSFYTRVFSTKANEIWDFAGWKLLDGTTVQPGSSLDFDSMASLNADGKVPLIAQWTLRTSHTTTVNFYVNQICQVIDANGDSAIPSDSSSVGAFTDSVWAATLNISSDTVISHWQNDANNTTNNDTRFILYTRDKTLTRDTDIAIRNILVTNGGYDTTTPTNISTGAWKDTYTGDKVFTVDSFPSDEVVMAQVRRWLTNNPNRSITLGDGSVVYSSAEGNIDQVNTNRFTIRYNKFFYSDSGDTWHIDGVLVAKQATTVIKKTFQGDPTAISKVKENYYISVTQGNTTAPDANLKLTLNPAAEETDGDVGYTSYDAASDTYTWVIKGEQGTTYNVKENNYTLDSDEYLTDADYTHTNIPDRVLDWTEYPEETGINFTGIAYAVNVSQDAFQTVSFRNIYIKPDALTIQKIDASSGRGIPGVNFTLGLPEGQILSYSPSQNLYSTVANDLGTEDFQEVPDNKVVTDANGSIMIKVPATAHTFNLTEEIPLGYMGIENMTVTIGMDKDNIVGFQSVTNTDSPDADIRSYVTVTRDLLTIKNQAPTVTLSAQKEWATGETPMPVQVELWVNGAKAQTSNFTVWLNESNNWTHTWNSMPLYIDGVPTAYTLRESYIGTDTAFDASADVDGYADFIVSYDPMVYYKQVVNDDGSTSYEQVAGSSYTDDEGNVGYAQHGMLKVTNSRYRGQIILLKQDPNGSPLAGAVFALYSDANCTQELARATTGALGRAIFDRQLVGTYYVKEVAAPLGYQLSKEVYTVTVAASGVTIANANGVQINAIANQPLTTDLTIQKLANMNSPLTGAGFTLTGNGKTIFKDQMVDANGRLVVTGLTVGTYTLTETVFPTGYLDLSQPITITVTATEAGLEISVPPNFSNDYALVEADGAYTLKVNNRSGYQLPQTGGPGTGRYLPIGLLLMAAAILPQLRDKKKRQRGRG